MGTITDAATLRALYAPIRENPREKRAKMLATVMPESGLAKPFLAMAMGQEMAGAEAWDADRESKADEAQVATTKQAGDAAAFDYAQKMLASVFKLAEKDAVAATQILKIESERGDNPYLKTYSGVTFNAPSKDGWATIGGGDGFVYHTYLPNLQEAIEAGPDSDLYKKTVIRIGAGKPTKQDPPKSRTVQRGGVNVTEEWNEEAKTWTEIGKGPAWKPGGGGDGAAQAKPAMLSQLSSTYTSKWLPLALENYRKQNPNAKDSDFLDPYGNIKEATVRAALTPEQQGNYDRGVIDAQAAVGRGINPAQAVDDVLRKFQIPAQPVVSPAKPATPAKPWNRKDVIDELKRRGVGGR
jgi:hypothetical protein